MWWKRKLDLRGAAFFRGTLAPTLESLDGLERAGIEVERSEPREGEIWAATLRHPEWGQAFLFAPRETIPLPDVLITFAPGLTQAERAVLARDAQRPLLLEVPARNDDLLRDRKRFLRFLSAALGTDGVAGEDAVSHLIWTPARLGDELAHDAPLDIIHVHVLHVVDQSRGQWLHSHGLGELGFVDFDVLRPSEELTGLQVDVLRAIAFSIVEGASSGDIEPILGGEPVALVDAATFMASASSEDRRLREAEDHTDRRVVCCDPPSRGLLGRLFGTKPARPSQLLSRGMEEGRHLVAFSLAATELCAARARESLALFERLNGELAELQVKPLVKLGYAMDGTTGSSDREHLWFEVHGFGRGQIDATLLNEPFHIDRMHAGQRAMHPVEALTDWAFVTPLGQLTPRNLELARILRELRPKILESIAAAERDASA